MKTILIGLVFFVSLHPLVFSSNPGSGKDVKGHRAEVYSPGRGIEQSAAGHESESPTMLAAPSSPMNAPQPETELTANSKAVGEPDHFTRNASTATHPSDLEKPAAGSVQSPTTALDPHPKTAKANLKLLKDIKQDVRASNPEALSLLWIVILVVLLLWLLGFGIGAGPFIHLLLLVFLILLILWLLRVI